MFINYVQAQIDLYILAFKLIWIEARYSKPIFYAVCTWTVVSLFLFGTASSPKVQGILGGTTFLTDALSLFFLFPCIHAQYDSKLGIHTLGTVVFPCSNGLGILPHVPYCILLCALVFTLIESKL